MNTTTGFNTNTTTGPAAEEGRKKARKIYRYVALIQLLLGLGLIISACLAVKYTEGSDDFRLPYYVGGFVVGALVLGGSFVSFYIYWKGRNFAEDDVIKREIACAVSGSQILAMLTFIGCFMGLVLDGIWGFCSVRTCKYDAYMEQNKALAVVILILLLITIGLVVTTLCLSCSYGPYFGVVQRARGDSMVIVTNQTGGGGGISGTAGVTTAHIQHNTGMFGQPEPFVGMNTNMGAGGGSVQELQQQNALLQQQLQLQQQLYQQQQQQHQQGQYPTGPVDPPPSYRDAVNAFPSAPPEKS